MGERRLERDNLWIEHYELNGQEGHDNYVEAIS